VPFLPLSAVDINEDFGKVQAGVDIVFETRADSRPFCLSIYYHGQRSKKPRLELSLNEQYVDRDW
jgi:hypothetical protein